VKPEQEMSKSDSEEIVLPLLLLRTSSVVEKSDFFSKFSKMHF
jgi:hypothetical protein